MLGKIHDSVFSASILSQPSRITGITRSSSALFISRLPQPLFDEKPIMVICPNDDLAEEFATDFESFSLISKPPTPRIFHFPTWESSPYSPVALSLRTRFSRLTLLHQLAHQNCPNLILTTLAGLSQSTLPKDLFLQSSTCLRLDDTLTREDLINRFLEAGYLRTDPVEDPGHFAVRGEIIDVFPPNRTFPIRIEFFGDLVEKIREFDPATQRASSKDSLHQIIISPAREVLIQPHNSEILRKRLKDQADILGIPRRIRDPILASIQEGHYSDHSEAWAPFAYPKQSNLWEYLPHNKLIIWLDELSCRQEWNAFLKEQYSYLEQSQSAKVILPPPNELFNLTSELSKKIEQETRIYLDQLDLESSQTLPKYSSGVLRNTDLTHESLFSLQKIKPHLDLWISLKAKIYIFASTQSQLERIQFLLEQIISSSFLEYKLGCVSEGFQWLTENLIVLTESEILGPRATRQLRSSRTESGSASKNWSGLQTLSDLSPGDKVVHIDHGIGRYQGITRLDFFGAPSDFLHLEYTNKDKLYLPIYRLNVIQKYVGSHEGITLDRLGSLQFSKTKEKVKDSVKKLAFDLVQLYAQRKIHNGIKFSSRDSLFQEFEAKFPFEETPDQLKAIDSVLEDLESGKIMDRLVCGDVGYGKTEVAIRAAFKAVSDGKQVVVLVPTTLLAQQHEISFKLRLKDYPIVIESLSRFKKPRAQKTILQNLENGKIDIVIGTHRLLSNDVQFRDLGIVIVDEEHRFGVEHKERLKTLKLNTHVLTLTATPIPRTLHMALSGLRDISLINTPPFDRLPIRTFVSQHDETLIKRAIEFELTRDGQVFYLHNRVQSIYRVAENLKKMIPHAKIIIAHGQMKESELEKQMLSFYEKTSNILVCTSIIESGLDLPSANTIIIDRADTFGLAQLYQIRGRVGRSQQKAYAYLLIPENGAITSEAKLRLETIQKYIELGSGFSIASHDLEIRGGGDLLGPQQSGSIAAVGFDLYIELLEEAVQELQGLPPLETIQEPEIKTPFPAFLSEEYIPDVHQRLSFYRRFSAAGHNAEIIPLEEELRDRYGNLPLEAQNLIWLIQIKVILKKYRIESLTVGTEKIAIVTGPQSPLNPTQAIMLASTYPHQYQIRPNSKFVAKIPTPSLKELFFSLETLLAKLS